MRIAVDEPEGGGMNEIDVAFHEFAKGGLGTSLDVICEALVAVCHVLIIKDPRREKSGQKYCRKGAIESAGQRQINQRVAYRSAGSLARLCCRATLARRARLPALVRL